MATLAVTSRIIPIARCSRVLNTTVRNNSLWRPYWWGRSSTPDVFPRLEDELERMHKEMDREDGLNLERFYQDQPIIEEDGSKKFRLMFDVSRFKPEEVNVTLKDRKMSIDAKHQSKTKHHEQYYEFHQQFTIPEGVKPEELTCKFTEEGRLQIDAPYNPPEVKAKETPIMIKKE